MSKTQIGIPMDDGFLNPFRTFCDGELSVNVGKFGGWESIRILDVYQQNGKLFPDRYATALFRKESVHLARPMYGPAFKFIAVDKEQVRHILYPQQGTIFPSGFCSTGTTKKFHFGYDLLLHDKTVLAKFSTRLHMAEQFTTVISKYHLTSGIMSSLKNQMLGNEYGVEYLAPELLSDAYRAKQPFQDGKQELCWIDIRFDADCNTLIFSGEQRFAYQVKPLFFLISFSEKIDFTEDANQYLLSCPWGNKTEIKVVAAIANDREKAFAKLRTGLDEMERFFADAQENIVREERLAPSIRIGALPQAELFCKVVPEYQHSLLIARTPDECAIRASSGKYNYFALWDHIYPIRDFIVSGDFATARRLLRFLFSYPYVETMTWSVSQLILEVNELLAFDFDQDFLDEAWPVLKKYFAFTRHYVNEKTGFVGAAHCCGVDNPAEVGLHKLFFATCVNSWYYECCRTLENLARIQNEPDYAEELKTYSDLIEKNFIAYFYNPDKHYLRVAVNSDLNPPQIEVFHNSSTIGLDYPYGHYLLRSVIGEIAGYKARELRHAEGYTAVACDSTSPCEMWKSVYMNQHIGHESKLARFAGNSAEGYRLIECYLKKFDLYKTAIETFNHDGCDGDARQSADWQAFSATGAYHGIWQALAGIHWHRGGICYLPGMDWHDIEIGNWTYANCKFTISIHGQGAFVRSIRLDGTELAGSLQIPVRLFAGKTQVAIDIERSEVPFDQPTLLQAEDVDIRWISVRENALELEIGTDVHGDLLFYLPHPARVCCNDQVLDGEYDHRQKTLWISKVFQAGDILNIQTVETNKEVL